MAQGIASQPYTLEQAELDIGALRGQVDILNELLTQADFVGSTGPNVPSFSSGTGYSQYSSSGQQKYISAADGNAYNTGRISVSGAPAQTINTTTGTNAITGTSLPVAIGTYVIDGIAWCTNGSTGADQAGGINGPAVSAMNVEIELMDNTSGSSLVYLGSGRLTSIGTRSGVSSGINSGIINGTHTFVMRWRGYLTFSASGNLTLTASCVTLATDTFVVNAFEYGLWPVS